MKKNIFLVPFLIFAAVVVTMGFVGFDVIGIVGLIIVLFFGIGTVFAGVIMLVKPDGKTNIFVPILLIMSSPIFIWFGYTMLASGLYSPMLSFMNDPTKIIYNPVSSPSLNLMTALVGILLVLFSLVNKPKNKKDKKFVPILILVGLLIGFFGGYSTYKNFFGRNQSNNNSTVVNKNIHNKFVGNGGVHFYQNYYLNIDVGGTQKDFMVSDQIYNIFKVGDNVSITYQDTALKTISLNRNN